MLPLPAATTLDLILRWCSFWHWTPEMRLAAITALVRETMVTTTEVIGDVQPRTLGGTVRFTRAQLQRAVNHGRGVFVDQVAAEMAQAHRNTLRQVNEMVYQDGWGALPVATIPGDPVPLTEHELFEAIPDGMPQLTEQELADLQRDNPIPARLLPPQ